MSDFGDSDTEMGLTAAPAPGQRSRQATPSLAGPSTLAPAAKKRAAPRFLGDGLSDDEQPAAGAAAGLWDDLDNLFDQDDDLPPALDLNPSTSAAFSADARPTVVQADADIDAALPDADKPKRQPRAKLDQERLLGPKGFPKLIDDCRKFKLGQKGDEEQDLKRLLGLYQLWAHDMFPRTNFADTVTQVEKLCHSRNMARELKQWKTMTDGQLPNLHQPEPQDLPDEAAAPAEGEEGQLEQDGEAAPPAASTSARFVDDADADEDFDAAIAAATQPATASRAAASTTAEGDFDDADLLDLDLDQFDADEEAMADFSHGNSAAAIPRPTVKAVQRQARPQEDDFDMDDFDDEAAIMAEMERAEHQATQKVAAAAASQAPGKDAPPPPTAGTLPVKVRPVSEMVFMSSDTEQ